jgi:hypothetical protein
MPKSALHDRQSLLNLNPFFLAGDHVKQADGIKQNFKFGWKYYFIAARQSFDIF